MPQPRQPFLHDLVCGVAAPTQVWSANDGQIGTARAAIGAQGVLHADVRVVSALELLVDGVRPEHIATVDDGTDLRFTYVLRGARSSDNPDEMIRIDRIRRVAPGRVGETITMASTSAAPAPVELGIRMAHDLTPVDQIKTGTAGAARPFPTAEPGHAVSWGDQDVTATLAAPGAIVRVGEERTSLELSWPVGLERDGQFVIDWSLEVTDRSAVVVPSRAGWLDPSMAVERLMGGPTSARADHRLRPWVERSLRDLAALRMATQEQPDDDFFAAGAPWYLTLFGRDSLWTARMLLPVDASPAISTLRTLARLAGTRVDEGSAQEPGKIPHELRRGTFAFGQTALPPLYYGTIDATPLWVCLLHDLWRLGGQDRTVEEFLDPLEAALSWIVTYGDADGDGFLEYVDRSGHGLANQGWKDSADAVRFADGRIAEGPVALCEVQGYAYEAACAGAELLEAFGRPGADRYREWADGLAGRFRAQYWCGTGADRYPALALDGRKQRVDSLTSNIGHLLGTGLLDAEEESIVARRVAGPELDSGLGLRTMSSADGGYNPLSYHCGSVWPHDTAIVIGGLQRAGLIDHASGLIEGLLRASVAFEQRLPELWSGEGRPVPYPAACRPQAWSAAAAVVVAQAFSVPSAGR